MLSNLVVVPSGKRCPRCKETKPSGEFHLDRSSPSGCTTYCKKCTKARFQERMKDPDFAVRRRQQYAERRKDGYFTRAAFRTNVKKRYGITFEDAVELLRKQLGRCANRGCGKSLSFDVHGHAPNRAVIDHCHRTGKVRGIMCRSCNAALGLIDKGENLYLGLLEYLSRNTIVTR